MKRYYAVIIPASGARPRIATTYSYGGLARASAEAGDVIMPFTVIYPDTVTRLDATTVEIPGVEVERDEVHVE